MTILSCTLDEKSRTCLQCRSLCVEPVCDKASYGDEVPIRCRACKAVTGGTLVDRLYATRFDRMPDEEPWRTQWLRLEEQHAAALRVGDHEALFIAIRLADARADVEREYDKAMWARLASESGGEI